MNSAVLRTAALILTIVFPVTFSGCARLQPHEYQEFGYKGEPVTAEGKPVWIVDVLGNVFGVIGKIILWNWKVNRHRIESGTEEAVAAYLAENKDKLGNVAVQLNRYAPQDSWRRLFQNQGVEWPYKYTLGLLTVLIVDTILIDRIFGGDRYNPYTHTVHIHSDLPSVALHELGHAKDFSERRYRGSYGLLYVVPAAPLYHEFQASKEAFDYIREEDLHKTEIEAYKILYPAYGTYAGSLFGYAGNIIGAIAGHIWGRTEARELEERLPRPKSNAGLKTRDF